MVSAVGVRTMPRPERTNSSSLKTARKRVNAWLTADCVIASRLAALDRVASSYAASNTGRRLRSMPRRLNMVHISVAKHSVDHKHSVDYYEMDARTVPIGLQLESARRKR